ncbi:hypothetical protein ABPG72_021606 [Tetrahymena utriculariae]
MRLRKQQKVLKFTINFLQIFTAIQCSKVQLVINQYKQEYEEIQHSTYLLEGQTTTYQLEISDKLFQYFIFLAQDNGQCSQISTQFKLANMYQQQNYSQIQDQELCQESKYKQNNFCKFYIKQYHILLEISIKCMSQTCLLLNHFFVQKHEKRFDLLSNKQQIEEQIQRYFKEYILINSQDIKDLIFGYEQGNCIKQINRYGSISYILEIATQQCLKENLQIWIISKCNNLNLTINSLETLDVSLSYDLKGYMYSHIFVIGECKVIYFQNQYILEPNIFYQLKINSADQVQYTCEKKSTILLLNKQMDCDIEERILSFLKQNDKLNLIQNNEKYPINRNRICFYIKNQNLQIYFGQIKTNFDQDDLINQLRTNGEFQQLQKDQNGIACSVNKLGINVFYNEHQTFLAIGQGFIEYEYFHVISSYINQEKYFGHICQRIMQSQYPYYLISQSEISPNAKLSINYDKKYSKMLLIQNQDIFSINQLETNLPYKILALTQSFIIVNFKIQEGKQYENKDIVIRTCCSFIYVNPIIIYFKYLYEQENEFMDDYYLEKLNYMNEDFFIYCWANSKMQQYYKHTALFYARIQNNEDLRKFYELDRQIVMKIFKFSLKSVDKSIGRGSEICLALFQNQEAKEINTYKIILDNEKYVQEIDLEEILYESVQLLNTQNKIIKMYYDVNFFNCFINLNNQTQQAYLFIYPEICYNQNQDEFQFLGQNCLQINQSKEFLYQKATGMLDEEIIPTKLQLNQIFDIELNYDNQYTILELEKSNYTQIKDKDYCSQVNLQMKIQGHLKKQYYYLEVYDLDAQISIQKKQYFTKDDISQFSQFQINYFTFKINPQQIKIQKSLDILKLQNQQIYFIFTRNQHMLKQEYINGFNNIDLQQNLIVFSGKILDSKQVDQEYEIKTSFFYTSYLSLQNKNNSYYYFRIYLQIIKAGKVEIVFGIMNSEWIIFEIEQMAYYQLTAENQKDNFQIDCQLSSQGISSYICTKYDQNLNSNTDFIEVEDKQYDCYLYLEYKSIEDRPVFFEMRYLLNSTYLQSFNFQQYQEIKVFSLHALKFLEIYNYKLYTSLDLILIISNEKFQYSNIYQNKLILNSEKGPILQLLSRLENFFKFKTDNVELIKGFNVQNLENQYTYFLYSNIKLCLIQEFKNGVNLADQNQNLVIFKEKVMEILQIDKQQEITTSKFQKSQINLQSNCEEVAQCQQKTIEINNEGVDYHLEFSPNFSMGEIISYKVIVNLELQKDYAFFFILQDEGSCSQFFTQIWLTKSQSEINQEEQQEEICLDNQFKENNFCKLKLYLKYYVLNIQIKCLVESCRARSHIFLDKIKQLGENKVQNLMVQKPALQIEIFFFIELKSYLLIYSQDIKYIFFEQGNIFCTKINKYGSISQIFEIFTEDCNSVQFTIISYSNKINLIMDLPQNHKNGNNYYQGMTHFFVIGNCFICQNMLMQYKLLSNVYYNIKNDVKFSEYGHKCEDGSNIIFLNIQYDFKFEEYQIETIGILESSFLEISLSKVFNNHAICLYLKDQNIQIAYGSSVDTFGAQENSNNTNIFKQAKIDENGIACISYEQNLLVFSNEHKYVIATGQGFFSYKIFRIKIQYDNLNLLYGQIHNKIQPSSYPIQIDIVNHQKTKKRLAITYSDQCKIVEQMENQDITISLDSQITSKDLTYYVDIQYSVSCQELVSLEEIQFSVISNRNTIYQQKLEQNNTAIKFYLPQEFKDSDFIIELFQDIQSLSTIIGKRSKSDIFLSPIMSTNRQLYYIQKQIVEQNWKEDPLIIVCINPTQFSLKRNYFDDNIQIYNFNFERIIQININQLIQNSNTLYIDLQQNKIVQTSNKHLLSLYKINQSLHKLQINFNQQEKMNEKSIDIQFCCDSTYSSPIKVYFKYLYEQDEQFLNDDILKDYLSNNLLIYCWGRSLKQEYYRYSPYIYTRIFNQEELLKIHSQNIENTLQTFQFIQKYMDQAIIRGKEICLALCNNNSMGAYLNVELTNQSYVQEIELQIPYSKIIFFQSFQKIIQVILENEDQDLVFQQENCKNASYYYSYKYILNIQIIRNAQDYQQVNKMKNYQILWQSDHKNFYVDYWFSNYELKQEQCSQPDLKIPPQIDGVLTKENNVVKNTEFLFLYLKASSGFNAEQFLFLITEYSHANLINQENSTLTGQRFQNFQFKNQYQKRVFKIKHQNELNFKICFCSKLFQYSQNDQINDNSADLQKKLEKLNTTYVFIYPEISLQQDQLYGQIQNSLFEQQAQICLQIYQKNDIKFNQNATGTILTQKILIQQLKINQAFNIQINSQNKYFNEYVIFEVEKSDNNYYLYLEYKFTEDKPVLFEVRYLQSGNILHRFYFQQSQTIQVLQLQNLKYIEIYNYEPSTNIGLTLILSEKQFSVSNIYRNQMSFNSFKKPKLLLLSRLPNQNLIISLQNNLDKVNGQQSLEPNAIDNIFINDNQVNYQLTEVHPNFYLSKKYYFLDVFNENVSIDIQIKYYINLQDSHGNFNNSVYEYTLRPNTFKFKILNNKLINKIAKDIEAFGLQNQKIYFVFSTNENSIQQEFINGINAVENKYNIVIFKEYLLEFKFIKDSMDYEITTSYYQNVQKQIRKEDQQQLEYFRIYFQVNDSTLIIPLSQIFKQQFSSKNLEIQQKMFNQIWMIIMAFILLLILIFIFMFKLKTLQRKIKEL